MADSNNNAFGLVEAVVRKMPNASRKEQFAEFEQMVDDDGPDRDREIRWYYFVNMRDPIIRGDRKHSPPQQSHEQRQEYEQRVESIKDKIVLLALAMPNGKAMSACTGSEMDKFGGAYKAIAKRVGPTNTVGAVLTEEQVKALVKPG